ncbi:hypothetical protein AMTR_s00016p00228910 [Amborella trichopoda]|uniref:Uncharacterized protein n=1 Tax=Amborella trichopoda TaxID=13333 RepID=W1PGT4_AMBTC|nr:hypothetical protein AMTR_s00016p00228910 [Amborella trichopoda]
MYGSCSKEEQRLREVAERARSNGSAEVLVLPADVSRLDECKRFIEETINHFGHLDHLVNNAGVAFVDVFEEVTSITNLQEVLNVNFRGAIYPTYYAIPHLRKVRGKIVVDASATAGFPVPRISAYNTSKAAVVNFYEPMSMEIGDEIGITSETPGWTESEISKGIFMNCKGMQALISAMPVMPADECAEGIVKSASQGERNITEPFWVRILILYRLPVPETVKWSFALLSPTKQWRGRQLPSKSLEDDAKSK